MKYKKEMDRFIVDKKIDNKIYPKDDTYYSCIISENNSIVVDGCSFTNCPKYFASDKYCSWDIRENRIFGHNLKVPSSWNEKSLIRIFRTSNEVKQGNQRSTIKYSNVLGHNNKYLKRILSFEIIGDEARYNVLNLSGEEFE